MGEKTTSKKSVEAAKVTLGIVSDTHVTARAEQEAYHTGELNPLIDPKKHPLMRSLLRFNLREDGRWEVTVGCPRDSESIVDTTGSMGGNVDVAMRVLGNAYESCGIMLPKGSDLQLAIGIFGDAGSDRFPFQVTQYEMEAIKIMAAMKVMVPERKGGDEEEDPQYAMFGAAYLRSTYANKIGLKGYHFVTSDAPLHEGPVSRYQLTRIFGSEVFEVLAENGIQMDPKDLPEPREIVRDLKKRAYAFFLQVGGDSDTSRCFKRLYGPECVIMLPDTEFLPEVQATIIGLTEGMLALSDVADFLRKGNMPLDAARRVARSVANIPTIGAQAAAIAALPHALPKPGDIFESKSDLWPSQCAEDVGDAAIPTDNNTWL